MFSSGAVKSLLKIEGGKHPEYERYVVFQIKLGDTLCDPLADISKVWGFTLDHASEADDAVKVFIFGHPLCPEGQLKGARHMSDNNILVGNAVAHQCLLRSLQQGISHLAVPVGNHYAEPHPRGIGDTGGIVIRKIAGCHLSVDVQFDPRNIFINAPAFVALRVLLLYPFVEFEGFGPVAAAFMEHSGLKKIDGAQE